MMFLSRYEGFGVPIAQAMAVGTPVIFSRSAAPPEVTGEAGLLVIQYSKSAMALGKRFALWMSLVNETKPRPPRASSIHRCRDRPRLHLCGVAERSEERQVMKLRHIVCVLGPLLIFGALFGFLALVGVFAP